MKQLSFCTNSYRLVYDSVRYETIIVLSPIRHVIKQLSLALRYGTLENKYRFVYDTESFQTGIFLSTIRHVFKQLSFGIQFGNVEKKIIVLHDTARYQKVIACLRYGT